MDNDTFTHLFVIGFVLFFVGIFIFAAMIRKKTGWEYSKGPFGTFGQWTRISCPGCQNILHPETTKWSKNMSGQVVTTCPKCQSIVVRS
jgi:ribosomal protein S27E